MVAIGTVGGNPKKRADRDRFESGLTQMMEVLQPHTIIVYGSDRYACFDKLKGSGVNVFSFPSRTAKVFSGRKEHE